MATDGDVPVYREMGSDDPEQQLTEIESLCMNCHEQGITRLLPTRVPYFREVVISSFSCDECGFTNREILPASKIQELGVKFVLNVKDPRDLNRQIVKSNYSTFAIPDLGFEDPPVPGKEGQINTLEGLLLNIVQSLEAYQPVRRAMDPENGKKIDAFINRIKCLMKMEEPFVVTLEDPSGNSFVENPLAPQVDENLKLTHFARNQEQDHLLGLDVTETGREADEEQNTEDETLNPRGEVFEFPGSCPRCEKPCKTNMKVTNIPYFKDVVIMATNCDECGYRDNEVKGGEGIEPKGVLIKLKVTDSSDLSRDVLKSDTAAVEIPEIGLRLEEGSLGGKFTTVEGLLTNIKDKLSEIDPFFQGDSADEQKKVKMQEFLAELERIIKGQRLDVHFILDDPAGNSFLQNVYAPELDPEMEIEHYARNFEQNELLGLNDMKTENYQGDS